MATNQTVEAPRFEEIRKEAGVATRDAVKLLWAALNAEAKFRRTGLREARDILAPKVLSDAPGAQQDNYDLLGCSLLLLTGAVARTFTGFKAPGTDESRIVIVHVIGAATYTFNHASASSDAENRLRNAGLGNLAVATDESTIYIYLNSLWRELNLA
jgi:hypothetical protein